MKNIPLALRAAKNQLGQTAPWLILVDLALKNGPVYNLVANTEDIVFQEREYTAIGFEVEFPNENNKGQIPTVTLKVSNVARVVQGEMEKPEVSGGIGSTVTLYIVNAGLLAENYAELTMEFEVLGAVCDAHWVIFSLGMANPLRRRFPLYRYMATSCRWQFKSAECAYAGSDASCARTLDACRAKANTARFGGEPGLSSGGVRFV